MFKVLAACGDAKVRDAFSIGLRGRRDVILLLAVDGPSAVATWRNEKPGIIFLDTDLTGINGVEVARKIGAEASERPSIVLISRDFTEQMDPGMAVHMGGDTIIPLPDRPETLVGLIDELITRRGVSNVEVIRRQRLEEAMARLRAMPKLTVQKEDLESLGKERIREIIQVFHTLEWRDYYQVLGLPMTASADQVRERYYDIARQLHPDKLSSVRSGELREMGCSVYRRAAEAYKVLMSKDLRRRYDLALASGRNDSIRWEFKEQAAKRTTAETEVIDIRNAKALRFFQFALAALKENDLKSSRINLQLALQLERGNQTIIRKLSEIELLLANKK